MTTPLLAARAALQSGDDDRALALAQQARAAAPKDPEPAFLLCCLLLRRKDPRATDLLATLEAFPDHAPGWAALGQALQPVQPAAARVAFQRAATGFAGMDAHRPGFENAYRLGMTLRHLLQHQAARAAMQRATAHRPASAAAWFQLGLLCHDLNDTAEAARALRTALAVQPDFHEAAFNLGVVLQEAGDIEQALDAYARSWAMRPAAFGRIAQALISPAAGRLWLHPSALRAELAARVAADERRRQASSAST